MSTKKESTTSGAKKPTRVRPKVPCNCKECNGKLVETRTKQKHEIKEEQLQRSLINMMKERERKDKPTNTIPIDQRSVSIDVHDAQPMSTDSSQNLRDDDILMVDSDHDNDSDHDGEVPVTKRRRRYDRFRMPNETITIPSEEPEREESDQAGLSGDEEDSYQSSEGTIDEEEILFDDDEEISAELFTTPESFTGLNYDSEQDNPSINTNTNDLWILLWIFKYQERFRLPDVATNALIGFFSIVLKDIDSNRFKEFPSTAYMARKLLEIKKKTKTFATCTECNKLYNIEDIIPSNQPNDEFSGSKCTHVKFPNHSMQNQRKPCGSELLTKVPVTNSHIWRPRMVYPLPCLKTQLLMMYKRPSFEDLLSKWTSRDIETSLMSDIYDGKIWKEFPSSLEVPNSRFFTSETADSHLGIMINLDWFQPFESSVYSCGVIYGVICNLPRDVRFKKENMLVLALLPGPNEVKLHRINHYLAPLVDELLKFWNGVNLPATNNYPTGRNIRMAVICCSNDIPAARKLCGHISALVGCHRCYKKANRNESQRGFNFGGFDDMSEWFRMRDSNEHRQNAIIWKHQQTNDDRKRHVSRTHVRWSEMLRLPYYDPIRHLIVDPMHCLFLGIAHWIVKRLWIDSGKINKHDLELMERRAKAIKIPADLGRVPHKIATGEGFSGFTADQWKSFILIYATPLMWDLLEDSDRKILSHFVRACVLLVSRIMDANALNEAHDRLLKVARLIEENYGKEMITPNIHLSLHIVECCRDYGPLYSFWCYSFERMNGILGECMSIFIKYVFFNFILSLGSFPNSRRQIEPELLRIIMQNWRLDDLLSVQSHDTKLNEGLKLLQPRPTSGSLAAYDNFEFAELSRFREIYRLEIEDTITGTEFFPGEMLHPKKINVGLPDHIYDLLVNYYNNAYDAKFITIADSVRNIQHSERRIIVRPQINQFGRIRIGSEVFGSASTPRYSKNSYILAKFIQENDLIEIFPGQVQFYFEHEINLQGVKQNHYLAYVKWFQPAPTHQARFHFQIDDTCCNVELWKEEFFVDDRDSIIPVHNIFGRFIPSRFAIGRRNSVTYMAVIPIGRHFHI